MNSVNILFLVQAQCRENKKPDILFSARQTWLCQVFIFSGSFRRTVYGATSSYFIEPVFEKGYSISNVVKAQTSQGKSERRLGKYILCDYISVATAFYSHDLWDIGNEKWEDSPIISFD